MVALLDHRYTFAATCNELTLNIFARLFNKIFFDLWELLTKNVIFCRFWSARQHSDCRTLPRRQYSRPQECPSESVNIIVSEWKWTAQRWRNRPDRYHSNYWGDFERIWKLDFGRERNVFRSQWEVFWKILVIHIILIQSLLRLQSPRYFFFFVFLVVKPMSQILLYLLADTPTDP